jgi:type I restriction enzyme, R subunit
MESPTDETRTKIQVNAEELVSFITEQTQVIGFWNDPVAREELRKQVWQKLEDSGLFLDSKLESLADEIIRLSDPKISNQGP